MLVIPSRWYENSPLVLLYALATRTPVIVTDVKGMTEFVRDDWNGYTFPMNDVNRLTEILQKVIDDPHILNVFRRMQITKKIRPIMRRMCSHSMKECWCPEAHTIRLNEDKMILFLLDTPVPSTEIDTFSTQK